MGPYSAGTAFLEVVPSFRDFHRRTAAELKEHGDTLGKEAGKAFSEGFEKEAGKGVKDALGVQQAKEVGREAGKEYSGAFRAEMGRSLAGIEKELKAIKVDANTDAALAKLAEMRTRVEALRKIVGDVKVGIDGGDALKELAAIETALAAMAKSAQNTEVGFNVAKAATSAKAVRQAVEKELSNIQIEVKTDRAVGHFRTTLKGAIERALRDLPPIEPTVADSKAKAQVTRLRAELEEILTNLSAEIEIDSTAALAEIEGIALSLALLAGQDVEIEIGVNAAQAAATLLALERLTEQIDDKDVRIEIGVDGAPKAVAELRAIEREKRRAAGTANVAANSFRAFSAAVLGIAVVGPLAIPILASLAAGMAALGVGGVAVAAGIGVGALALTGIGGAVQALGDVQRSGARDALAYARTMRSASNALRDAEIGAARARETAARTVSAAEQTLTRTLQDQERAQRDLISARARAQDQIEDMALRARGGELAERQALLDLQAAQRDFTEVMQFPDLFNDAAREQVSINLERAKLSLDEIRLGNSRIAEEQERVAKTGVEGTDVVIAARERLAEADQRVIDAQHELRETVVDASRTIEDANRRLADAQLAYNDALQQTGEIGSGSIQRLRQAMESLSPAGRDFALFLHGLRDEFNQFKFAAQQGLLPPIQEAIGTLLGRHGPQILSFISVMSAAMGKMIAIFVQALSDPIMVEFFATMAEFAPTLLTQFAIIATNIGKIVAAILIAFAPLTRDLGGGLVNLTNRWVEWSRTLQDNPEFQAFLGYVREAAPIVGKLILALALALLNLGRALAPYATQLAQVFTAILMFIAGMDPEALGAIVISVIAITVALQAMFAIFSAAGTIAGIATAIAGALAGTLTAGAAFAAIAAGIVGAVILIAAGLYLLYRHSETFRRIVDSVWDAITVATRVAVDWIVGEAWPAIRGFFVGLGEVAMWVWENVLSPTFNFIGAAFGFLLGLMAFYWHNVGAPLWMLFAQIVEMVWNFFLKPIFVAIGIAFGVMWGVIEFGVTKVIGPVLELFGAILMKVWDIFLRPGFELIGAGFELLGSGIVWVWDHAIRPALEFFGNFVRNHVLPPFKAGVDAVGTAWDRIREYAARPVRFVVETIINKGLIDPFNWLARAFGTSEIPHIRLPAELSPEATTQRFYGGNQAFAAGGQVGGYSPTPTADNIPIWATAGEYMHPVSAVQYYGLDFMDAIRKRLIPREMFGFAEGGLIGFGRELQQRGFSVTEHPAFGGVTAGAHGRSSLHYSGQAIDVNWAPGTSALEQRMIDGIIGLAKEYGLRTIWRVADHYNHAHFDTGGSRGLRDMIGGIIGGLVDQLGNAIADPVNWLKSKVEGYYAQVAGTVWGDLLVGLPRKVLTWAAAKIESLLAFADFGMRSIGDTRGARDAVMQAAAGYGWNIGAQWGALDWLVNRESSWNPLAQNPASTAFGLFQFLDSTWRTVGFTKSADPNVQAAAGLKYIAMRYGTPLAAKAFHQSNGWYSEGGEVDAGVAAFDAVPILVRDSGGALPPGLSAVLNLTGSDEQMAVYTRDQWRTLQGLADSVGRSTSTPLIGEYHAHTHATAGDTLDETMHVLRVARRGGVHPR